MINTKVSNVEIHKVEDLTSYLNNEENNGILLEIMTADGKIDYVGFGL